MRTVLLLRDCNVGGHAKLPVAAQRALLEGPGTREVAMARHSSTVARLVEMLEVT